VDLDPGFSVFFTPESEFGMRKKILVQNPESGINIPEHNSEGSVQQSLGQHSVADVDPRSGAFLKIRIRNL